MVSHLSSFSGLFCSFLFFSFFSLNQIDVEMCVEAHVFEGAATTVVFSSGVELTAGQTARMNNYVHERGLGLGAVFVHTITLIDVAHNGLVNIVLVLSFFGFFYLCFILILMVTSIVVISAFPKSLHQLWTSPGWEMHFLQLREAITGRHHTTRAQMEGSVSGWDGKISHTRTS